MQSRKHSGKEGPSVSGLNYHLNKAISEGFTKKETFEKRSKGGKGICGYLGEENFGQRILSKSKIPKAGVWRKPMWLEWSDRVVVGGGLVGDEVRWGQGGNGKGKSIYTYIWWELHLFLWMRLEALEGVEKRMDTHVLTFYCPHSIDHKSVPWLQSNCQGTKVNAGRLIRRPS